MKENCYLGHLTKSCNKWIFGFAMDPSHRIGIVFFPKALKFLRTYEIKPYIIFIKAPPLENLKESRMPARARATEADAIRPFSVSGYLMAILV